MSEFEDGTIIDGRYRVLYRIGAGGMADVYLAQDEQLDREIALKLLHRRFAEDAAFVERFRREAQAAASLQHPNVVSVFDRGTFDGTYYIAMEYLPGRTLKQIIREEAPLEVHRAIDIAIQMLKAARFAHRRGVIHRDLKPHNVVIDDNDHVKVTDFGIARAGASDMTETGSIMGTAQYLSPEQAQGHAVSEPSDLYSVGVVLYEMITGRVPFDGESPVAIALKHVSEAPIPPSQINPEVSPALEQTVLWSLNKNPADRPADADEFITALEHVRDSLASPVGEITASMRAVSPPAPRSTPPAAYPPTNMLSPAEAAGAYGTALTALSGEVVDRYDDDGGRGDDRQRRGGTPVWPWLVGLVVVLLVAGGVVAYLMTRPKKVLVPAVVNLSATTAQRRLDAAGFSTSLNNETSNLPVNVVIAQSPLGDTRAKSGSTVLLTVSSGPGNTTVPYVVQYTLAQAKAQLKSDGLKVGRTIEETSSSIPAGQITRTYPASGSSVQKGTTVVLYVSSGITVPNVVNDDIGSAQAALNQFNVTTVAQTTTTADPGTVVGQNPPAGKPVPQGSTVTLTVASAPTTVKVPRVVDETANAAVQTLANLGFSTNQIPTTVHNPVNAGLVVKQDPTSNSVVSKGTVINIYVGQLAGTTTTSGGGSLGNGSTSGTTRTTGTSGSTKTSTGPTGGSSPTTSTPAASTTTPTTSTP